MNKPADASLGLEQAKIEQKQGELDEEGRRGVAVDRSKCYLVKDADYTSCRRRTCCLRRRCLTCRYCLLIFVALTSQMCIPSPPLCRITGIILSGLNLRLWGLELQLTEKGKDVMSNNKSLTERSDCYCN